MNADPGRAGFKEKDRLFHRESAGCYDDRVTRVYGIYHSYSLYPFLDGIRGSREVKALDMGCGTGVVSLALAARGFSVVAVDHSPEMVRIAKEKAQALEVAHSVEFEVGDVEQLRYGDGEFDVVVCQGLLHHLENLEPTLSELHRVLKHRGVFYISEPCRESTVLSKCLTMTLAAMSSLRVSKAAPIESAEAPVDSRELMRILDRLGLDFDSEYLTHVPYLELFLPDSVRLVVSRILSFPWRKRRGDIVFVHGRRL